MNSEMKYYLAKAANPKTKVFDIVVLKESWKIEGETIAGAQILSFFSPDIQYNPAAGEMSVSSYRKVFDGTSGIFTFFFQSEHGK